MKTYRYKNILKILKKYLNKNKLSSYLNISICNLKIKEYKKAIEFADKALKMDSKNTKALYRKGMAHLNMGNVYLNIFILFYF